MREKIETLACSLQAGNIEAFPELMEYYRPIMQKIVFAITRSQDDTEDIIQETFVIMLEKIEQWHGKNFNAWILRIAKNLSIDYLRKRQRNRKHMPFIKKERGETKDCLMQQEELDALNMLLAELPPKQKEILYLKHFEKMPIREIALRLDCAEGTIKATLFQTLKKLKNQFQLSGWMD